MDLAAGGSGFPAGVGVAIVSHNSREKIGPTLASLERAGCPQESVLVVDVASTDGLREWLTNTYPGVAVLRLEKNDGPNPGRNLAIRNATSPYVFLMDPDVQVQPETIQRLHAVMVADPTVKIGSPIVAHLDSPDRIQYAGTFLHFICEAINPWMDRTLAERGRQSADIGVAAASGLLIECRAAIDVGLFDERYFMGKDDGDFTHRMRIAGHRILEPAGAIVLHQSRPRNAWLFYYQIRNRWHFMLKNYEWSTLAAIAPCLLIHEPLQLLLLHAKGHGGAYWKAVGGLFAMLPTLRRDRAFVRSIRKVPDSALLKADSLIVRSDLAGSPLARAAKNAYERFLSGYWRFLRQTVLAG
jgi:N-acetylglucosaminyl-diphospho-decaprenol L-rhamnosyltransferase